MSRKLTLLDCQNIAASNGGFCRSTEYKDANSKMLWECKLGHQWETTLHSLRTMHTWCDKCAHTKLGLSKRTNIEICQNYAIGKRGKLLSTEYKDNRTKMLWECEFLHQWWAAWHDINGQNQWCPLCQPTAPGSLGECQEYVKMEHEGFCLSTEYINSQTKMLWQCKFKHQWMATFGSIKNSKTWCPKCSAFKTERLCREILEQKLGYEFKKTKFHYYGQQLEFDGLNDEHSIAFEFHGYQHYIYPNTFYKTIEAFNAQLKRDDLKEQYCAERDIRLLIIPYTEYKNLESYINQLIIEGE
jgi:hypothetical protein